MEYLKFLSGLNKKKLKIIILFLIMIVSIVLTNWYIKIRNARYNKSYALTCICGQNMSSIIMELFYIVPEDYSSIEKTIDYSNGYWWVDVLKKRCKDSDSLNKINKYFYCPLDNERKYPSSYKINPNLRLNDFEDGSLQYFSISLEGRILAFYENKDYHRKNYKHCYFLGNRSDYLTDQEIVECIKTTRKRIKRAKAKR